jgi:hypothetical protein
MILIKRECVIIDKHFLYPRKIFFYINELLDYILRTPLSLSPSEHLLWVDAESTPGIAATTCKYGNERVSAMCIKIVLYL